MLVMEREEGVSDVITTYPPIVEWSSEHQQNKNIFLSNRGISVLQARLDNKVGIY